MKTAMQELFEHIENVYPYIFKEELKLVFNITKKEFIEKEKKQIIKIIEDSQQIDFWDKYENEEDYIKLQLGKTSNEW